MLNGVSTNPLTNNLITNPSVDLNLYIHSLIIFKANFWDPYNVTILTKCITF
jgi:hypothetical protein